MASDVAARMARLPWRVIGWGGAALLLALPFVAMQFQATGVDWSPTDFAVFGLMLLMFGIPLDLAARANEGWSYRGGAALGLLGMFLTVWANLAVGIVGSEDNPANMLFFGALLVGVVGSVVARGRAKGLALAMFLTAASLGVAFVVASAGPTDEPMVKHSTETLGTAIFAGLFLGSAALFRKAARDA